MPSNFKKNNRLPWILLAAVLIVAGLGLFLLLRYNSVSQDQQKPVIDLSQPITKNPDQIATTTIGLSPQPKVQVRFSWEISGYKYNDALYFTPEEYEQLTPQRLDELKYQRIQAWAKMINEQSKN